LKARADIKEKKTGKEIKRKRSSYEIYMGMCMNHYHLARRKYIIRIYISGVGGGRKKQSGGERLWRERNL
jgi:hypothetical protein